jgi:hypothetical protein
MLPGSYMCVYQDHTWCRKRVKYSSVVCVCSLCACVCSLCCVCVVAEVYQLFEYTHSFSSFMRYRVHLCTIPWLGDGAKDDDAETYTESVSTALVITFTCLLSLGSWQESTVYTVNMLGTTCTAKSDRLIYIYRKNFNCKQWIQFVTRTVTAKCITGSSTGLGLEGLTS